MTRFGVQLHGSFPMWEYPALARAVERHPVFAELTVHDVLWWRPVWPILTLIAEHTERVEVGPDVTHPYLVHPVVIAQNVAALDELSRGRAVLGLGRGSFLEPLGLRRREAAEAVRETAGLVRRFLARDRTPHAGRWPAGPGAVFNWTPPRPEVPIFVGAFGPGMAEAAAAWADEVRPPGIWDTAFFLDLRSRVERAAAALGRLVEVGCDVWVSVDRDRGRARELARVQLARFLPQMGAMTRFYGIDPEAPVDDRVLDTLFAAGSPADLERGLERLLAARPATVVFSGRLGPDPVRALELLAGVVERVAGEAVG